jgi:small subunit ribosomal protein S4
MIYKNDINFKNNSLVKKKFPNQKSRFLPSGIGVFKNVSSKFRKNDRKNFNNRKITTNNFLSHSLFKISKKGFKVFDSMVFRRFKILRRLRTVNYSTYNNLFSNYPNIRWLKDYKLVSGLKRYGRVLNSLESQGLQRKVVRRRMSDYSVALQDKQKIKYFYAGIKEFKLKNIVHHVFSTKINPLNVFLGVLESKLSTFLFRINFSKNFKLILLFIKLGYIKVNGVVISDINYNLSIGDIVTFFSINKNQSLFVKNLKKKMSLYYYPSNYIECSFSMLNFMFYRKPVLADVPYFFNMNLKRILYFYNYKGLH